MSCKTPIFRAVFDSTTVQNVAADGLIQFPNVTSNECCNENQVNAGTITLTTNGTYEIHFNASLVATAAGTQEVQMYRNGSPVPGAHAIATAAAIGDTVALGFTALVTVNCCCGDTISFRCPTATSVRIANVTFETIH